MKKAKDDKRLQTIPEGSYEAGAMNRELRKNNSREVNDLTTDAQGNGYRYREIRRTDRAGDESITCSFLCKSS